MKLTILVFLYYGELVKNSIGLMYLPYCWWFVITNQNCIATKFDVMLVLKKLGVKKTSKLELGLSY